jgi:6-phosphogluconolactonase
MQRVTFLRALLFFLLAPFVSLPACNGSKPPATCLGTCIGQTFVFASAAGEVSSYPVNANGTLGAPSTATGTAVSSFKIAAAPTANYLYQTDVLSRSVLAYSINTQTGALTPVQGSPYMLGNNSLGAVGFAITPAFNALYVSDFNGSIAGFSINGSTGQLAPLAHSPFAAGDFAHDLAIDSSGKFLYANGPVGSVLGYTINADGSLSPVPNSPYLVVPLNAAPEGVALDPSGKFLYVSLAGIGKIAAFSIDGSTGAFSQIAGSPFPAGNKPEAIGVTAGHFLYAVNAADNTVSAYKVSTADGSLTAVAGSPFPTGTPVDHNLLAPFSGSVAPDKAGSFLWIGAPQSASLASFGINSSTGALTPLGVTTLPTPLVPGQVSVAFH